MAESDNSKPTDWTVTIDEIAEEAYKALDTTVTVENVTSEAEKRKEEHITIHERSGESQAAALNLESGSDHREFKEMYTCPQIPKETRWNKVYEALMDDMKTLREKYKEAKETIEEELKSAARTKKIVIKDIKNYKIELLSRLDDLEKNSIGIVNARFKQITEKMKMATRKIDDILTQIDETLKESEHDKKTQTDIIKKTKAVLHSKEFKMNADFEGFEGVSVCLDKGIKALLDRTPGLVKINRPCKANLTKNVDITFESDRETCGISDICSLPDGTLVMTDLSNDCLKRLDESYNRKSTLRLDGGPLGICETRYGELAVTLRESRAIQFVEYTPTEMKLTKSFPADCSCNYICCIENLLYVTCEGGDADNGPGHVRKFDMTGNLLGIIETDDDDHGMFTTPLHITSNADKSRLFITDMDSKVIVLDKTGKKLGQYRHTYLESPFGISVLPNDNILVSNVDSHSVQQIDESCRYVGTVLSKVNGLQNPVCIKVNASSRQIIVSMDDCNKLLVFTASFPSP